MKILYQWAQRDPTDWQQIDSALWASLPIRAEPAPGQMGGQNNVLGWINDLIICGLHFNGSDHVAIEDVLVGLETAVKATAIWDDPDDYPPGERRARVWTILPLGPDPNLGGAINTRQSQVIYAEGQRFINLTANPPQNTTVLPWPDFVPPPAAVTRHQVWLTDAKYAQHTLATRSFRGDPLEWGWRDWADHLPDSEVNVLPGGRRMLKDQRSQGRYSPSEHTLTWFLRDTNLAQGWIAATHEDSLLGTAGGGQTESVTTDQNIVVGWGFATPSNEPNSDQWPTGTYRTQLDCTAASAGLIYQIDTSTTAVDFVAEWYRLQSDLSSVLQTRGEDQGGTFSGTGLKLATSGTEIWSAGNATDRFGFGVNADGDSHGDAITLRFSSDAWADGPWAEAITTGEIMAATAPPQVPQPRGRARMIPYQTV